MRTQSSLREYDLQLESGDRGRVLIFLPFDPKESWGRKQRYYVKGSLNGADFSETLSSKAGRYYISLSRELRKASGANPGDTAKLIIGLDETQRDDLPQDLILALNKSEKAKALFDKLTTFYRKQYVQWVEDAKRDDSRATRIELIIANLETTPEA
jgi:hypothetical protein